MPHQSQASAANPYASDNSVLMRTNSGGGGPSGMGQQHHHNAPTTSSPHASPPQGPMSFTRALELTDKMQNVRVPPSRGSGGGNGGLPPSNGAGASQDGGEGGNRESVYDVNYEISV